MIRTTASLAALASALLHATTASAQTADAAASDGTETNTAIVVTGSTPTRSSTELPAAEMQKILPGVSPLKAIQTLPGVLYITADPWGYNE